MSRAYCGCDVNVCLYNVITGYGRNVVTLYGRIECIPLLMEEAESALTEIDKTKPQVQKERRSVWEPFGRIN